MTGRDEKRTFKDEDLHARPDEVQGEHAAREDKLKRHGDQLQESVDKATGKDPREG